MRFVGCRWTPCDRSQERAARALVRGLGQGWRMLLDWRGLLLLVPEEAKAPTMLPHGMGAIFGEVHGEGAAEFSPSDDAAATALSLTTDWRGSYVALLIDRGHDVIRVLRSPDGVVPVYFAAFDGVSLFFSDAVDFISMAPAAEPDLEFLAAFLCYPRVVARRTGLRCVEELAPGEALVFTRNEQRIEALWTPDSHAKQECADFGLGVAALRNAAERTVSKLCEQNSSVLHRLSGGFDSSAVLGLVAAQLPRELVTCVNEFWPGAPEGDEREIARTVARRHGVRLVELAMDPHRVAYERITEAPFTAKPTLAALSFADRAGADGYAAIEGDMLTSGQGGDHVFQRSRLASLAADAVRDRLPPDRLLAIALDTARLTKRSVWGVFQTMIEEGLFRQRPKLTRRSAAARLLVEQVADAQLRSHPWLQRAAKLAPARANRIWHLCDALSYHDTSSISLRRRSFPILLSQPVIEACLRIPPYVMTEGGKERALARAAFTDLVPEQVFRRTLKGDTTRYFAAILAANRQWIGDTLPDGRLANCGIVKRDDLAALASANWRQDGYVSDGLYSCIAVEAWLQRLDELKRRALQDQGARAA